MRSTAVALIRRGISSSKLGYPSILSFYSLCSTFHTVNHKDRPFSSTPRIDFSCITEVSDAIFLFREMVRMRPQPSVVDFTKLLNVIVKMKKYSAALCVFDEMLQLGVPVNEYTMNIGIHCYCQLRQPDFGFAILGSFFKRGYKPDVITFSTLIKGLFLDDKVAEAEILFKKLLSLKLCEPDEVTILTVINGLCKAGYTLAARDLLSSFGKTSYKATIESYNTVVDSLCKDGMVDDALHLLSKMNDMGISPDVVTYSSIIQGLCNFGRWKDVENIVAEMVDHKISLNAVTFNILIDALCKEGEVKQAEDLVEIMMQRNVCPDIITYSALIDGYCKQGQMVKARKVFDSFEDRGLKPSIISYNTLINGYCKRGMVDEAWDLFLEVPRKGLSRLSKHFLF
ncbi:hypothetical protein CDL12_21735 [Handroanthus impetiginosus]|uniref:Pentacotripeptide-repeat region of PRORP domain-containing protein n=1 Tax=Handroanthus impetiginosus TaxID=429701 RepID=A0A2G9GKA3_9LAMI|nr:hypothetical protein CDL12_21735 [Handroanthus impetiginosus]